MDKDKLVELAERCEAATGPDDATDWAIAEAVGCAPGLPYTASLDAAMTLVPEGWEPLIDYTQRSPVIVELYGDGPIARGGAVSGPLALCAAALRSHAPK